MTSMVFNIFFLLIEVFFWNRIIISLIMFMRSVQRKKLWSTVLVTIVDGFLLWYYCIDNFLNLDQLVTPELSKGAVITISIIYGAIIVFMYVQTIITIAPPRMIKSRRQRAFERKVAGKEKNYAFPIVVSSVGLLGGIVSWVYYQVNYISDYKIYIMLSISITVISALIFVYTIINIIFNKRNPKNVDDSNVITIKPESFVAKESNVVFILEVDGTHEFYKAKVKGTINLPDLLGTISDYYYISSYGVLRDNDIEYKLFGLKTSSFDVDLYSQIKMDRFESEKIEAIVPYLEKNHQKIFTLDENKRPINSFDA